MSNSKKLREYWIWEATGWAYSSEARARAKAGNQTVIHVIEVANKIPYREPSDWDHHLETPEQTAERDALIERKSK